MPGLRARSPIGSTQGATTHWYFSPSLPPFLSLKINKIFKKKRKYNTKELRTTLNRLTRRFSEISQKSQELNPQYNFIFSPPKSLAGLQFLSQNKGTVKWDYFNTLNQIRGWGINIVKPFPDYMKPMPRSVYLVRYSSSKKERKTKPKYLGRNALRFNSNVHHTIKWLE